VSLRWLGPERLQVTYAAGAEEFLRVDRFGRIRIEYRVYGEPWTEPDPRSS
jgi:hypothetical protein